MRIDSPKMTSAEATGSFKGSFSGSFEGDIQADSVQYANVLSKPTLVSGSGQIDVTATANYVAPAISDNSGTPTLVSGITAAEVRTAIGVDAAGTDNSTDVTLNTAGGPDYLTLTGQQINLGTIDISGDTNFAVSDTTGQTGINLTLTDDTLSGTLVGLGTGASPTFAGLTLGSTAVTATAAELNYLDGADSSINTLTLPDSTTISSFGASLVDDADAAAARTTLGVDAAGTDNSTDVTLANTNYLSLSGQELTGGTIPIASGGTGATSAGAARTALGVDAAGTDNSTNVTLVTTSHDYLSLSGQAITLGTVDISDDTNFAVSDTSGQTGINLTLSNDTVSGVVSGLTTTSDVQFANLTLSGDLTVNGDTVSLNATNLEVEDKTISVNRGGTTAASADGAGLHISGANESLTWDNGNSRFNFSDDLNLVGNLTLSGTVDGRDVATDGTKLDGIASGAEVNVDTNITVSEASSTVEIQSSTGTNDSIAAATTSAAGVMTAADKTKLDGIATNANAYSHPTEAGDDISVDTGALTGATVISDLDFNITTNTLGHVTDANGTVSTRDLTLSDLGYTGATDANNYSHPTFDGDDISIDTGALTGATVISDLDFNVTTDTNGHVTDANGTVATRTLTLANLGYTGATDANNYSHPTFNGDDINIDTGALSGATVISDLDFNITTDTNGHVTDANGTVSTRTLTAANIGLGTSNHAQFHCLGIGTAASTVTGEIRATGDITAYYSSDERLKDNIVQLGGALDKVNQLRGVSFDWKEAPEVHSHEGNDIGVIAQEVEAVYPELVHERENGYKAVDYVKLSAVLIEAVKELSAKVEALENK